MKLTCKAEDLSKAAAWAAKIAPSNPANPVMAGVKLTAGDDLTLSATDYETFGTARCTATIQQSGSVVVSARLLAAVAKVPSGQADVTLVSEDGRLSVTSGRANWKLPELESELWPQFPDLGEPVGRIDGAHLEDSLSRVAPAADDGKMNQEILRGVHLELGDTLTATATNTYRMARLPIEWTRLADEDSSVIVPATILRHIGTDGDVTISTEGGLLGLSTRQFTVMGRLIAGKYKDVRPILRYPEEHANTTVTVSVQELREAIESAAILLDDTGHLSLEFDGESVTVSKVGKTEGDADSSVDVQGFTGDPIEINVKAQYIKDALTGLHSPSALFIFTDRNTAGFLIQPCDEKGEVADEYRHVLMPIKLGSGKS